tara:strand:+ start:3464 stop:4909 length:1446 start_codon:yes stop_codon:yes gene_type:complete
MLTVPMDYKDPSLGNIQLPVTIHRATATKLGTLIINFGGPWENDVTGLHRQFDRYSPTVREHYDMVSFTPRGVAPNPINCHPADKNQFEEIQRTQNLTYMNSDLGATTQYTLSQQSRQLCSYDTLSKHAGTRNTMQDVDMLRKALGLEKISYLGYSYGTHLGLAYLLAYPQHVDKMMLDSNFPPSNDYAVVTDDTAYGIENVFRSFFQFCVDAGSKRCAVYQPAPQDIQAQYQALINRAIAEHGIPTSSSKSDDQRFSVAMLQYMSEIVAAGDVAHWPQLATAWHQAIVDNNADLLMALYVDATGYEPAKQQYSDYNLNAMPSPVVCNDFTMPSYYDSSTAWIDAMNRLRQKYPLAGAAVVTRLYSNICIGWPRTTEPLLPVDPKPITQATPTVLLVNNLYDPVTPLSSAQSVSRYLTRLNVKNKVLAWAGVGHMSYAVLAPTDGCIYNNVDAFFATGKLPTIEMCTDKVNPFIYPYPEHP